MRDVKQPLCTSVVSRKAAQNEQLCCFFELLAFLLTAVVKSVYILQTEQRQSCLKFFPESNLVPVLYGTYLIKLPVFRPYNKLPVKTDLRSIN